MFNIFPKKKWPELSLEEIKKRARILVIDDSDFFYLKLFKADGYSVEKWDDVVDLNKLENGYYDIILLDIQGVGRNQSEKEGLGILEHVKSVSPAQIIISYSNADWSLKYQEFFNKADYVFHKSDDYVHYKKKIDEFLKLRFSISFYIDKIVLMTSPYVTDQNKLKKITHKAILSNSPDKLQKFLNKNSDKKDIAIIALQILQAAAAIGALL